MNTAPIIVFAYKRPEKLLVTLRTLAANSLAAESQLFLFCDGPKTNATATDHDAIAEVRDIAKGATGFASIEVIAAERNKGLARSVIDGVTAIADRFGRVIVVEEDTLLSPHFLQFMNDALDRYAEDKRVFSVGAWNYFVDPAKLEGNFFLRYPDSQSWAVWKRSWDLFEQDGPALERRLKAKGLMRRFDADGRVHYFSEMLAAQVLGRIDSWAIRWTANCVLQGKVCVYPRFTLVKNAGLGAAGGTHESAADDHNADLALATATVPIGDEVPEESPLAIASWAAYVREHFQAPAFQTFKLRVWRLLPRGAQRLYQRLRGIPVTA